MVEHTQEPKFLLSVKHYKNKGLTLFLDLEILDDTDRFKALLSFQINLEIEPDLLIKDAYIQCTEIQVEKNELLPKQELDFYEAARRYKIDQYSKAAQQLAEVTKDYLTTLIDKANFQVVIDDNSPQEIR